MIQKMSLILLCFALGGCTQPELGDPQQTMQMQPPPGKNTFWIDADKLGLPPGVYTYCIQTHVEEKGNILYRGTITLGQDGAENIALASYTPGLDPKCRQVLHTVKARYYP